MTDDLVARLRAEANDAFTKAWHTGNGQVCEEAADEIERLRRWQKWGEHVFVCHIKGKVCWHCLSPDYQDQALEIGTAQMIKLETRRNGGFND